MAHVASYRDSGMPGLDDLVMTVMEILKDKIESMAKSDDIIWTLTFKMNNAQFIYQSIATSSPGAIYESLKLIRSKGTSISMMYEQMVTKARDGYIEHTWGEAVRFLDKSKIEGKKDKKKERIQKSFKRFQNRFTDIINKGCAIQQQDLRQAVKDIVLPKVQKAFGEFWIYKEAYNITSEFYGFQLTEITKAIRGLYDNS